MDKPPDRKPRFKTSVSRDAKPADPEALFRDLKRSPSVQYLWSHQSDLLRDYDKKHLKTPDIALELPTGSGKTLIGLLLAEYRRRKFGERVIYLCPTRQLVHQVASQAKEYGIGVQILLPRAYEGLNNYRLGNVVGVTTYSSLFNTNPRINDPQLIVLDDAHSAENYIADLWSLAIGRKSQPRLYTRLIQLLAPDLDPWFASGLLDEKGPPETKRKVDLISLPTIGKHLQAVRELVDEELPDDAPERYAWLMIQDSLHASCLYVSWHEILMRPFIPPTMLHKPFANATQRLYMSATLGEGGELERIAGIRKIERLPMPPGWEKQASGRRFFLFPNLMLDENQAEATAVEAVARSGRGLILTPRVVDADPLVEKLKAKGVAVLGAKDIEHSLDSFTKRDKAALVLTNRYDGIDLPGSACRLVVLYGLPAGTNLQEQFLFTRLGATSLLRDRLRTRLTQGAGRCCRNAADFAAVLIVGQRIFDFLATRENVAGLHPEMQAEIAVGIQNSEYGDPDDLLALIDLFYEQGNDWDEVNADILKRRDETTRSVDPASATLSKVVSSEVDFMYLLWSRDYAGALERAIKVTDQLGGTETGGYRALWYYFAGVAAWLEAEEHGREDLRKKASELFIQAGKASRFISWFTELAYKVMPRDEQLRLDVNTQRACEGAYAALAGLGFLGKRFSGAMTEMLRQLGQDESKSFETGLQTLGRVLGFESDPPPGSGAPDSVWKLSSRLAFVFEAKSEETPGDGISLNVVRQATTHRKWVQENLKMGEEAEIITVVVTPRRRIAREAQPHAEGLHYLHIDELRDLAKRADSALQRVRSQAIAANPQAGAEAIRKEFGAAGLLPTDLVTGFTRTPLGKLPVI